MLSGVVLAATDLFTHRVIKVSIMPGLLSIPSPDIYLYGRVTEVSQDRAAQHNNTKDEHSPLLYARHLKKMCVGFIIIILLWTSHTCEDLI